MDAGAETPAAVGGGAMDLESCLTPMTAVMFGIDDVMIWQKLGMSRSIRIAAIAERC